jgi:plasmid stabilization system protein ParE
LSRIIWANAALGNLRAIEAYIAQFNPFAAAKVAAEIIETAEQLADLPQRGRIVAGTSLREVMTSYPYIIRYRVTGEDIIILRIRHMARNSA